MAANPKNDHARFGQYAITPEIIITIALSLGHRGGNLEANFDFLFYFERGVTSRDLFVTLTFKKNSCNA